MSDDYYYDPTAESGYEPVDTGGDNYDLQGNYDLNPSYDPRANSGLTNFDREDPYANTPYDASLGAITDPVTGIVRPAGYTEAGTITPTTGTGAYTGSSAGGGARTGASKSSGGGKGIASQLAGSDMFKAVLAYLAYRSMKKRQGDKDFAKGHMGGVPEFTASRTQLPQPEYEPYSGKAVMGRQNFSPVTYTPKAAEGGIMGLAAGGLRDGAFVIPADVVSHFGNGSSEAGLAFLAKKLGATPIKGKGDGMSDSIDTTIEGRQPAKVANEEALVSPEKVAALGKGDAKKGAKVLYAMMDRVRKARTGTKKQGKQIKPDKYAPGGIAGYVGGGAIAFSGADGSTVSSPTADSSTTTNLSAWAGPGITNYIAEGTALADADAPVYTGPLTAGTSPLQTQAFTGYGNLATPSSIGTAATNAGNIGTLMQGSTYNTVGSDFTPEYAQQYMNPYIKAALDPQMEELSRQNQITQMGQQAKLAQAGAFGGSRDAIMRSENARNLGQLQAQTLGTGYATAYDKAMQQFNADQTRKIGEAQFGATQGLAGLTGALNAAQTQGNLGAQEAGINLQNLAAQSAAGAQQRGIEQEGITATRSQWEQQQQRPFDMINFKKSLYSGLPISAASNVSQTTDYEDLRGLLSDIFGLNPPR